ncbi:MAG TPA: sigma-70 family RNA polymerase sigma factor [Planctomycetota bacterium]|jgi:RNA polymerase sigma-70 factor|nr:sigma-70 family RNA polymerase sigma factor [Planctomycetota bacterium]
MALHGAIVGQPRMDAGGFEAHVRLHHRRLLAYALALTRKLDAAEDLVQDALLIAHRDLAKFDASRDFGAWVRGIVRFKYLEWTRAHRAEQLDPAVLDGIEQQHQAWDRAAEEGREDATAAVRDCMKKLPPHLGETLDLFYRAQDSCTAIAGRLGISEVVVRKRLQRARESLADCIRRRLTFLGG